MVYQKLTHRIKTTRLPEGGFFDVKNKKKGYVSNTPDSKRYYENYEGFGLISEELDRLARERKLSRGKAQEGGTVYVEQGSTNPHLTNQGDTRIGNTEF